MPRTEIVSAFSIAMALAVGGALVAPSQDAEAAAAPGNAMDNRQASSSSGQPGEGTLRQRINQLPAEKTGEIDRNIFHAQVLLDAAGFSPGVIDGMDGDNFTKALRGFQEANDLDVTGELDDATRTALLRDQREPTKQLRIDSSIVDGNFVRDFPDSAEEQAELERLNYRNLLEEVAERFHTTPGVVMSLNDPTEPFGIGSVVTLPNVLPASRDYEGAKIGEYRDWFNAMNVNATGKKGERILVDESEGVLEVYDAEDALIATFPVTTGSENDPLPIGDWEVTTYAFLPPFSYQPDLFWDVPDSEEEQMLPPGPNGPVGIAWLDLTKENYGLHGTSEPQTIGYAQSHGCLRLTNWDVLKLAYMLEPGFAAEFVE
ncbi:L,D-transpeptidase family protein [Sphingomicrobium sp. XHP0239]|uniref:L,D-transpeptidase family protein n=1 Tax=Sphingomicrobium maritimum TaxID=3133972 RepID=UPI0031CC897D